MVRKITALILALTLMLVHGTAWADIIWPEKTEGQKILKEYVSAANRFLIEQGEPGINSLFEAYPSFETFGITMLPDADIPEEVEITAYLYQTTINRLEVRVSDFSRFPRIAASFIQALYPETMSRADALAEPTKRMQRASKAPESSFEDQVEMLNGTIPYIYYAYYPNQYHDRINWLQMTIIFPLEGYWGDNGIVTGTEVTKAPDTYSDHNADYEGYNSDDDYNHLEVFMTPTPEPDSAAAEYEWK